MDITRTIKEWLGQLGYLGLAIIGILVLVGLFFVMPVLTLLSLNHLNEAFGWGWNAVDPFSIWNILATAVIISVLGGIFGGSVSKGE